MNNNKIIECVTPEALKEYYRFTEFLKEAVDEEITKVNSDYKEPIYSSYKIKIGDEEIDVKPITQEEINDEFDTFMKQDEEEWYRYIIYTKRQLFTKVYNEDIPISELKNEWKKMVAPEDSEYFDKHIHQEVLEEQYYEYLKEKAEQYIKEMRL